MAQIHLLLRFVVFEIEQMPFAGVPNDRLHAAQASEIEPKIEYPPAGGGGQKYWSTFGHWGIFSITKIA